MSDRSHEIVRDYELLELVGSGSFATVYRARHRLLDRISAIKIIHTHLVDNQEALQRFKEEAKIISDLEHPHIVRLYEFWTDEQGAYIVMNWMEGKSLRDTLDHYGKIPIERVSRILKQIAPALNLVHRKHIVHRDLKPANIMFDKDGNAYIADFGLAKWHQVQAGLTNHGEIVGTPAYMPPEQAETRDEISGTADIYSLGVILYEMLTGAHPFGEAELVPMILHHMRDPLPALERDGMQFPPALNEVIQIATRKKPSERFQDVVELAGAFEQAIQSNVPTPFLAVTTSLSPVVHSQGDLHARVYTRAGAVLENPRRLFGRDDVVEKAMLWLDQGERVLLQGLAGIGKSSIAGHLASRYLGKYQKQVIWVELGRQDAHTLFEAIANALDVDQEIAGKQGDEQIAIMREILLDQDALLVIDNVWNERAILPIMRAIPYTMPTLITSRLVLSFDGIIVKVNSLDEASALQMLSYHAGQDFGRDGGANDLAELLGYHPYGLELSGKRLKVYPHLKPTNLAQNIQTAIHDGHMTGILELEEQRSVKDLIDESVQILPEDLLNLFVLCGGLFSSRPSLDLLALVAELDRSTVEAMMGELQRNGLLTLIVGDDMPMYAHIHDLTYAYIHTLFNRQSGGQARVVAGVRQFLHGYVDDYDALEFELLNILGTAKMAYRAGDHESLIDIMCQLVVEANYLTARGVSSMAMELLHAAIDVAKAHEDFSAAHYLLGRLGDVNFQIMGRFDLALDAYSQALDFARKMGNLEREAIMLSFVATSRFQAGMEEVESYYEEASRIAEKSGNPGTVASIFQHRSFYAMYRDLPDYQMAIDLSNSTIQILHVHNIRNEHLIGAMNNRAVCEQELGQIETAVDTYLEAYQLAIAMNNRMWIARIADNIAQAYHFLSNRKKATAYLNLAVHYARQIGYDELISEITMFANEHQYVLSEVEFIEENN